VSLPAYFISIFLNLFLSVQTKLWGIDVGNNQIPHIENISHLHNLEEFWMSTPVANPAGGRFPDTILIQ